MDSVYYGDLLDSSEILKIGLILSEFKHGVITYLEFKDKMIELGYELDVELIDSSRLKLLKSVNEFQERVSNNTIIAKDINSFFSGDFIFYENIGRCDLPTGDYNIMKQSIKKIKIL